MASHAYASPSEAEVELLSQRHFLAGIVQLQWAQLPPLMMIGVCSLYLPDWRLTAALIVVIMLSNQAMSVVCRRLHACDNPAERIRGWGHYNKLLLCSGALWSGLMFPAAASLGKDIASTFVCVIIIVSLAVTSMMLASQRASLVHFLVGIFVSLLPQALIFMDEIGPIPAMATIVLVAVLWSLAGTVYRQNRSLLRTQLEKEHLAHQLAAALEKAEFLASRDSLTGLYNRRAFEKLAHTLKSAAKADPMCLVLIDLDHFKSINDRHGHATGDAVLQKAAQLIVDSLGPTDILGRSDGAVARWGGEEFLLLLSNCHLPMAAQMAERLRGHLASLSDPSWPAELTISGSFGVACWGQDEALHQCISDADQAMYRAKQAGRNRVEMWQAGGDFAAEQDRVARLDGTAHGGAATAA